ncbi:unnamed protein product [Psylliodes chrysocephalus]|uniref:Myb/SANT-like DNA-binding domain-containing protein n=1 Tax=Psylliodes chrysocephalus TaxID=3402493 RepID=A0A9P0CKK4_9CUCU|nr:unnamed protein product [Psylliodes chrysocephala]
MFIKFHYKFLYVNIFLEMNEFIILNSTNSRTLAEDELVQNGIIQFSESLPSSSKSVNTPTIAIWTHNQTLKLIDLYKLYRKKVGTLELRTLKKMWEAICSDMNGIFKSNFLPSHCENKWRVIERNYKKYIDSTKQTGGGRKVFEYFKEMDEIFGKKSNIRPELLLSSNTISHQDKENNLPPTENSETPAAENAKHKIEPITSPKHPKRRRTIIQEKKSVLEVMRMDKKEYYGKILDLEKEKLAFKKEKLQKKLDIEIKKLEAKEKETSAYKDRNDIMKVFLEKNIKVNFETDEDIL